MFGLVPSETMRAYFKEIGFTFTDFQKATLIWNAPDQPWKTRLAALEELAAETGEELLKTQIAERVTYERKAFEKFQNHSKGRYIYVVKDEKRCTCGFFASFDMAYPYALSYMKKYEKWNTQCHIEKQMLVREQADLKTKYNGQWNPNLFPDKPEEIIEGYDGWADATVDLDRSGEISDFYSDEMDKAERERVSDYRPERFENHFIKIPFDLQVGAVLKDVTTGEYYISANSKADWDAYMNRIEEKNLYVEFMDAWLLVHRLTEHGTWSHSHINPLYLDYEFTPYVPDDEKNNAMRRAYNAMGDYWHYKGTKRESPQQTELVLKTTREYMEICAKSKLGNIDKAKCVEDIMD